MIKIEVTKDCVLIKGHANYSEFGNDIVCASISSIATTTVNAIIRLDESAISFNDNEGYLKINILKHTDVIDSLITNMISLFEELEKQYSENIKILK